MNMLLISLTHILCSFIICFVYVQRKTFSDFFNSISAYVSVLDIFFICQHTLAKTLWCDTALR